MTTYKHLLMACVLLAACEGNPFIDDDGSGGPDPVLPPGTTDPSPSSPISRREPTSDEAGETGNGYAEDVAYDQTTDTFSVDGLAFDGGNVYQRGAPVGQLGPFRVYEADTTFSDSVTGTPISQFGHRAIYGVSTSGDTEFAVVRTGAYIGYGFGGFVYQRNGGVTLPSSGQAHYEGDYAAVRDFNGSSGLEFARGDMTIDIDFNDFNDGAGVAGEVSNRSILDINGNDITSNVIAAINTENEASITALPTLRFAVGPGVLDANGEIVGTVNSNYTTDDGAVESYESGNYYAVISGDATTGGDDEIVGIIVVEAADDRAPGVTVRETGGFILYRN